MADERNCESETPCHSCGHTLVHVYDTQAPVPQFTPEQCERFAYACRVMTHRGAPQGRKAWSVLEAQALKAGA